MYKKEKTGDNKMETQKKQIRKYYGFEYADGIHTTTGDPNKGFERFNGRLSIAGDAIIFHSLKTRNAWLNKFCSSYGGRIAVTRAELRRLCAGLESSVFAEYVEYIEWESLP